MELPSLQDLADNIYIVLGAYLCVFVPWTLISVRQFVSSEWRPVRVCRHDAIYHLIFIFLPMPYLIFYTVLQAASNDFKEMAGAIVALTFCAQHAARTIWALWQLNYFHSWTITAITALRAHGIQYVPLCEFSHGHGNGDPRMIADCICINDTVVDPHLTHGLARCYLAVDHIVLKLNVPPHLSAVKMFFFGIRARLIFLTRLFVAFFQVLVRLLPENAVSVHNKPALIRPVPHDPVELWITWASVFVAQGLGDWVTTFSIAVEDILAQNSKEPQHFYLRRDYFAAEILASALHIMPPCSNSNPSLPNPYFLSLLSHKNSQNDVRFTKQDMLRLALSDGRALPYNEPHIKDPLAKTVSLDKNDRTSYSSYANKLRALLESFPAQFSDACLEFDTERLEWLTILLHFGISFNQGRKDFEHASNIEISGNSDELTTAHTETEIEITDCPTEANDFAVQNLLAQLGYDNCKVDVCKQELNKICAYPFEDITHMLAVSNTNRHVLQVGYQIDACIALMAGSDIEFLQYQIPKSVGYYPEKKYIEYDERFAFSEEFQSVSEYQKEIEKARLNVSFVHENAKKKFLECSLNFMGYGMELVRSKLATWVQGNGATPSAKWAPPISFSKDNFMETNEIDLGLADQEFSDFLVNNKRNSLTTLAWFQSRLVCSFQQACFSYSGDDGGPSSIATIALCMLSFPALTIKQDIQSTTGCGSDLQGKSYYLDVDSEVRDIILSFSVLPSGAPQSLGVRCIFRYCKIHRRLSMSVSLRKTVDEEKVSCFFWEDWKNCFLARCSSNVEWKTDHKLPSVSCYADFGPMNKGCSKMDTGVREAGESFFTWQGWPPFRHSFTLYELLSDKFLMEKRNQKVINLDIPAGYSYNSITRPVLVQDMGYVSYNVAKRSTLRFNTRVVQEVFLEGNISLDSSHASHISRALEIVDEDIERTLFILEIGALQDQSEDCLTALVKTVLKSNNLGSYMTYLLDVLQLYASQVLLNGAHESTSGIRKKILRLVPHYQNILTAAKNNCSKAVVTHAWLFYTFSEFCPNTTLGLANELRSVLLKSNDFSILPSLAVMMDCNEKPWTSPKKNEYVRTATRADGTPVIKANLVRNKNYSHWQTKVGKIFKKLATRYAAIKEKDPLASVMLATDYHLGTSTKKDWVSAMKYYSLAVDSDFASVAINGMVIILSKGGHGVEQNISMAKSLLNGAYHRWKHPGLLVTEANLLLRTQNGNKDKLNRAIGLLEAALKVGNNCTAAHNLAGIYLCGKYGIQKDVGRAKELLEMCLYEDSTSCMQTYTTWFLSGVDIRSESKQICVWCHRIVTKQCTESMVQMARHLTHGNIVQKDFELSFKLLQTALWDQHNGAEVALGNAYAYGNPYVLKNDANADFLLRRSMEREGTVGKIAICRRLLSSQSSEKILEGLDLLKDLAVNHGDLWAVAQLAQKLAFDGTLQSDLDCCVQLYQHVIKEHSVLDPLFEAENPTIPTLIEMILSGPLNGVDMEKALDLFQNNTELSLYSDALMDLAEIYTGNSKLKYTVNVDEAKKLLSQAIKVTQNPDSMERIAVKLACGKNGLTQDLKLATQFLERVIAKVPDRVSAAVRLSSYYSKPEGGVYNPKRSLELLENVILRCEDECSDWHVNAVVTLSTMFFEGFDAKAPDSSRGISLMEDFARRFKPKMIMTRLGLILSGGMFGVTPDLAKAEALFEQNMIENDCTDSMVNLAVCLFKKESKAYNPKRAHDLIIEACRMGNSYAAMIVNSLKPKQNNKSET